MSAATRVGGVQWWDCPVCGGILEGQSNGVPAWLYCEGYSLTWEAYDRVRMLMGGL